MRLILGITTYKRINYLHELLESFEKTKGDHDWRVIIHNDAINDDTTRYLSAFDYEVIESPRKGVHHGTNEILQRAGTDFDYGFKVDDDIFFKSTGWADLYINYIKRTGKHHVCYKNKDWKFYHHGNSPYQAQGAFWTFTPEVIKKVGFFDMRMGFRGIGHINFSVRCCMAGFNNMNDFRDVENSNLYIGMQLYDYYSALTEEECIIHRAEQGEKMRITRNLMDYYVPHKQG